MAPPTIIPRAMVPRETCDGCSVADATLTLIWPTHESACCEACAALQLTKLQDERMAAVEAAMAEALAVSS